MHAAMHRTLGGGARAEAGLLGLEGWRWWAGPRTGWGGTCGFAPHVYLVPRRPLGWRPERESDCCMWVGINAFDRCGRGTSQSLVVWLANSQQLDARAVHTSADGRCRYTVPYPAGQQEVRYCLGERQILNGRASWAPDNHHFIGGWYTRPLPCPVIEKYRRPPP